MHFGLTIFPTEYSISMVDLGRAAEERGFESLWVSEHTHIPVSRKSRGPEAPSFRRCTTTPSIRSWRSRRQHP
jgi:alkanesulfonate monooxygenase SsuD/methylene tetrahydromethanopterin reductase-like flavin-dependent oxidoreductase (luciferase family)